MYCKHCGKQIADDSVYCQFCGSKQDIDDASKSDRQNVKVELEGELKTTFSPKFPELTGLQNFCKNNIAILLIYGIWFVLNFILLVSGDGRNGFWPHPYLHRETLAEHSYKQYLPWSDKFVDSKFWDLGPEEITLDWDIDRYGWSEFLTYVVLIPLIIIAIRYIYKYFKNKSETTKFDPSEGLRRD